MFFTCMWFVWQKGCWEFEENVQKGSFITQYETNEIYEF